MKILELHKWDVSYKQARELQEKFAQNVQTISWSKPPEIVAGLDCAFSPDKKRIVAAVVVIGLPDLEVIETVHAKLNVTFPYIPGLLSFREAPVCIKAAGKLKNTPESFLVDGQGIAHPRRLGLACHLGLFLDTPTIGCAKSRLIGQHEIPRLKKGSQAALMDHNERIGTVLRTRDNIKPLYISVGHKCSLNNAVDLTLQCCTRYRLPEPTRLAHHEVTRLRTS